jgi:hypothetical protein
MLSTDEKHSARVEAGCALTMGAVAFITPWLMLFAIPGRPPHDSPYQWAWWVVLLVWILGGTFGVACVSAGGRVRRIGAAILVGDALGFLVFWMSVIVVGFFTYSEG